MTVLRSRKSQQHSPKSRVEIEPLTPAKEVEPANKPSFEDTPSLTMPVISSQKTGSVSIQGLRRSARLSLNTSLNNDVGSRGKRKVENIENGSPWCVEKESGSARLSLNTSLNNDVGSRGKRKVENIENSSPWCVEKESGSARVPDNSGGFEANVATGTKQYNKEDMRIVRKIKSQKVSSLDVEEDGDLRSKPEISDPPPAAANKNEKETVETIDFEEEGVVVDGVEMNGNDTIKSDRSLQEKEEGKQVEVNSSSDNLIGKPEQVTLMADTVSLEEVTIEGGGTNNKMDPKERFKHVARENASKFAHFSVQEEDVDEDEDEDGDEPQKEANGDVEDWPGPFSTAFKIISSNMHVSEQKKKTISTPLIWVPNPHGRFMKNKVAPSLEELCISIMAENVDAITSLESVPDVIRHKLTQGLCDSRKMNHHFLNLLASGSPSEIRIKDCSWLNEDQFLKTFEAIDASNLTVLQLDQCGRCLPDYVLYATLAHLPGRLSVLTNISLKGACRLSDAGLNALVTCASALRSINLGCCSLLTSDAIINLADKLGSVLKELYIDECFGIDAKSILPALFKLQNLEVLSISRFETVNDTFITQFVAVQGYKMKELVLADCTKLTDKALKAIAKSCPGLCAIDLTNLCKLSDTSLAHLANGCQTIQTMKCCRNTFSDEAVAAYLETCGGSLTELSLNHVDKVAHHTALSLAKHAKKLQRLDLSWCREMRDEAVGLIVDSCLSLETLKLFGCTQITNVFTDGHSNRSVKIIGLQESQILKNIVAPDLLPLRYSSV